MQLSPYQEFIHLSRYARWIEEENRRETWPETVARYIKFWEKRFPEGPVFDKLQDAYFDILNMEVMPSMRAMMTAGTALEQENIAGYNCCYVEISELEAFSEIMYILMCGTGVGFSVESRCVEQLPIIASEFTDESDKTIVVEDSRIGWANALRELLSYLVRGRVPRWDLSEIRPAGARLKTFGGRASGPDPLAKLFSYVESLFRRAAGRQLTPLDCHDLVCKIADIVVVGGVRRSALISLSDLHDEEMSHAKSGRWWETHPHRALANNSAVYEETPDMWTYMDEMRKLYESRSGERGIFNRGAARRAAYMRGRSDVTPYGTNPCMHPDTLVETVHGRMRIADITEPTMVYTMLDDGTLGVKPASAAWVSKKDAETVVVTVASGKQVRCTPDHKIYVQGRGWVEARNLVPGRDRVVHLLRSRRGAAYSGVKLTTQGKNEHCMEHHLVWSSVHGIPVPDGYDIHHVDGDTYNNDIDNLECLSHGDHARLTALEQPNDHQVFGSNGQFITHPASRGGAKTITAMPAELRSNLHQYDTVVSVVPGERTDVYDMTVEDTHNFIADFVVVHNCGEIILRNKQFCNLTEVVLRAEDSREDIDRKLEMATFLGTLQSSLTDFQFLSEEWKSNCEEERLLGVSLTGVFDSPIIQNMEWWELQELAHQAQATNAKWSFEIGIEQSKSITCVKPSGTVSQLVDAASGVHPRYSPFYIRRVRGDNKDPLTVFLKDAGVPNEPDANSPANVTVFSFPVASPKDAATTLGLGLEEHFRVWLNLVKWYCDHNASVTFHVKEDEWLRIFADIYKEWDDVVGVTMLPHDDHVYVQAPYEVITEKTYNEMIENFPIINWEGLREVETEDTTTGTRDLACSAGVCEVVDIV